MGNLLEKAIALISPRTAANRAHARQILSYYEAAIPGKTRKGRREAGSGNVAIQRAGTSLREQARHLEENHDIAKGALDCLVINVVGPAGIGIEPQPRNKGGEIHDAFAEQLLALWRDWQKKPEVTFQHDWASCQRLLARSWFRDGEAFNQVIEGINPYLDHGTKVPMSLEMLEADYVPLHLMSNNAGVIQGAKTISGTIVQGIEINTWGRPVGYWVYKEHPADFPVLLSSTALKRIPATGMQHIATRHRIRQLRGVTVFATVLARLDDLKDYEESERVAAKVAASMAAFIKKGAPEDYESTSGNERDLRFSPGMVFDDLKPGEDIGTIDTNRPNPNLETYRSGQLRAAAGGIGMTYSALAKNYNGSYSSQRQELVEGYGAYGVLSSEFGARIVRPTYERFVAVAVLARLIKIPADLDLNTVDACLLIPPQMPWIDPEKEANANAVMEDRCYISAPEIIRKRGSNPHDVLAQQAQWLKKKRAQGLPDSPQTAGQTVPPVAADTSAQAANALAHREVMGGIAAGMAALASKPSPAQNITVTSPEIHNHLPEPVISIEATMPAQEASAIQVSVAAPVVHVAAPEVHIEAPVVNVAAPQISNEITVAPAAISKIEIASMPARQTKTEVVRDQNGNIITTKQTESDL